MLPKYPLPNAPSYLQEVAATVRDATPPKYEEQMKPKGRKPKAQAKAKAKAKAQATPAPVASDPAAETDSDHSEPRDASSDATPKPAAKPKAKPAAKTKAAAKRKPKAKAKRTPVSQRTQGESALLPGEASLPAASMPEPCNAEAGRTPGEASLPPATVPGPCSAEAEKPKPPLRKTKGKQAHGISDATILEASKRTRRSKGSSDNKPAQQQAPPSDMPAPSQSSHGDVANGAGNADAIMTEGAGGKRKRTSHSSGGADGGGKARRHSGMSDDEVPVPSDAEDPPSHIKGNNIYSNVYRRALAATKCMEQAREAARRASALYRVHGKISPKACGQFMAPRQPRVVEKTAPVLTS